MSRLLLTSVDGMYEVDAMLFRYTATLAGSAGMTLTACIVVFQWDKVKRDAGYGTMFMVFLCWFLWSSTTLVRTVVVFLNNSLDTLEHDTIRHMTFLTETFFNAISMWLIAAAYECQRRALTPRTTERSHRVCLVAYMSVIGVLSMMFLVSLVVLDRSGATVTGLDVVDATEAEPVAGVVLARLSWFTWSLRCVAVGYPALVALWLKLRRHRLQFTGLPKAVSWIVLFLFVLNTPYLVIDPLFVVGVLDPSAHIRILGLMKTFTYMSGIAISFVMGFAVRGFDAFYNSKPTPSTSLHRDLFVFSDRSDAYA
ncbi:hypothetical protein B5M09_007824 [Aphanomyces astaci]|uniref:Uncharacterized protein n=1 Tax=Aphanomyces astaci TaxID=112090 RepID=A0A425DG87_APHAT|nr:hypothetical protein B5M09_007824 [Aphanomyces astaci]